MNIVVAPPTFILCFLSYYPTFHLYIYTALCSPHNQRKLILPDSGLEVPFLVRRTHGVLSPTKPNHNQNKQTKYNYSPCFPKKVSPQTLTLLFMKYLDPSNLTVELCVLSDSDICAVFEMLK